MEELTQLWWQAEGFTSMMRNPLDSTGDHSRTTMLMSSFVFSMGTAQGVFPFKEQLFASASSNFKVLTSSAERGKLSNTALDIDYAYEFRKVLSFVSVTTNI